MADQHSDRLASTAPEQHEDQPAHIRVRKTFGDLLDATRYVEASGSLPLTGIVAAVDGLLAE